MNMSLCKCGKPWEFECQCPDVMLNEFHETLGANKFFYFEDLENWLMVRFATNNINHHIQSILNLPNVEEIGPGYVISEISLVKSSRATRVGIIGQNGNDGLHYEEMRGKPSMAAGFALGAIAISMVGLGLYQMVNMRSFGIYPDGRCAYEQINSGKTTCPEVMPDKYNKHTVSPDWGMK